MNIWHDISKTRITKNDFISVIEISKGGKNKYELDKETGMLKLDRVLYTATHYKLYPLTHEFYYHKWTPRKYILELVYQLLADLLVD